jgi:hypothetical protein
MVRVPAKREKYSGQAVYSAGYGEFEYRGAKG